MESKDRIIVALDYATRAEALAFVEMVGDKVGMYKVGLELFTSEGPDLVREIIHLGGKVFLDLKFKDIPNTMAGAAKAAAKLGVYMFNVHASAGIEGMIAAAKNKGDLKLLAVTVLTSFEENNAHLVYGAPTKAKVLQFARDAKLARCDGVVCSPQELKLLRKQQELECFVTVTPGIRAKNSLPDDQNRTMTAAEAYLAGADYEVIGRPITQAADPLLAISQFAEQISNAAISR